MKSSQTVYYFILAFVVFGQTQAMTNGSDQTHFKGYTIKIDNKTQNNNPNTMHTDITIRAKFDSDHSKYIYFTDEIYNPILFIKKIFDYFMSNNQAGFSKGTYKNYSITDNSTNKITIRIGIINRLTANKYDDKPDIKSGLLKTIITQMEKNNCERIIANLTEKIPPSLEQYFLPLNDQKIKNTIKKNNPQLLIFKLMQYHFP